MGIEFQCDECGQFLNMNVDTEPGAAVKCSHCGSTVVVPAALASLPRPRVTGQGPPEPPPRAAPDGEYLEEEHIAGQDRDAVMTAMAHSMPWIVSVFFHVGLALILYLLVMIAHVVEIEKSVVIPNATFSENPGGSIAVGRASNITNARQMRERNVNASGDSNRDLKIPNEGEQGERADLIGLAAGAGGGNPAAFGPDDPGGGPGPPSRFGGTKGGNAHHVVYLIDRSGSMFDTFDAVKAEIANSVGKLKPVQDFHVILFADGDPLEKPPMGLTPPTDKNKELLADFLTKVRAERTTNPVKAIARAFDVLARADKRKRGKIIYMLTDGAFPDNEAVLTAIRRKNVRKDVLINTFLYGWRPPIAEAVMKQIARENGGKYRYISPDE